MTSDRLRGILEESISVLKNNRAQVTPEILDQLDALIPLFRGLNASTIQAAALACHIKTEVNLGALVNIMKDFVNHERIMLAGASDTLIHCMTKILETPEEIERLAKLF